MNKPEKPGLFALLVLGFFALLSMTASAAVPTEITEMLTDVDTVWTSVKGVIISVLVFTVLVAFAYRTKRSRG